MRDEWRVLKCGPTTISKKRYVNKHERPSNITLRVLNKIVLNRLNWNLKQLHDKKGGGGFFSLTFKMVHSEAF